MQNLDMPKLEVTKEQLRVIQIALEHYRRIGMGQFSFITEHPTFDEFLSKKYEEDVKTDWAEYHQRMKIVKTALVYPRNLLIDDRSMPESGSWGIYHPDVDESCRVAFDIMQVIRHEKWKVNPNRNSFTVDSGVHLTNEGSKKIKVEL